MDDQMSQMSLNSSMMDSIVSGAIESIAMMSIGSATKQDRREIDIAGMIMKGEQDENSISCLVHEGRSTRVYHYIDSMGRFEGQAFNMAVKILNEQFPEDDQIAKLKNEFDVSVELSGRCRAVRNAVGKSGLEGDGPHSICLEWVPGKTLREWTHSHQRQHCYKADKDVSLIKGVGNSYCKRSFLKPCLCLALEITRALGEIHEVGGYVLCNMAANNIIVHNKTGEAETFSVHIIGLSSASYIQNEAQNSSVKIKKDLKSLGEVLFELFSGKTTHHSGYSGRDENGRLSLRELRSILMLSSIPSCIAALVLDLLVIPETCHQSCTIENGDTYNPREPCYQAAYQVEEELRRILVDLDTALLRNSGEWLEITPGKLYGREKEQAEIINTYNHVALCKTHEAALVSGFSGVGKTALVKETLGSLVSENGGRLIHVKFDQLHQGAPLAAIIAAFSEVCTKLAFCQADELNRVKCALQGAIDSELLRVLTVVMPALRKIVSTTSSSYTNKSEGPESLMAKNQFKFAFQKLVSALTKLASPLILLFDDLQWADSASIELLDALVADNEIKPLLIIECYRSNEVDRERPLYAHLNEIRSMGTVSADIHVENLITGDVEKLLSDAMRKPHCDTNILADTVCHKTGGNVLLVIQFINSLWDEGLLQYSSRLKVWSWDIKLIKAKKVLSDAASVMAQTILYLPPDAKLILEKMSCLGCHCEESILGMIVKEEVRDGICVNDDIFILYSILEIAICKGLVEKVGSKFKFTHDQIQHAAYLGIPKEKRELWHLQIAKLLLKCGSEEMFVIVDQLNRGRQMIKEEDELVDLVKLNFHVGEKAMSSVSFVSAAAYLKTAIKIMKENQLKLDDELHLKMYVLYAEAEYCNGNFTEMHSAHDFVFTKAGCLDDKLPAYYIRILALVAQDKKEDAIMMGLDIMEQLGQTFPNKPDRATVVKEFSETTKMLENTDPTTLTAKQVVDKRMEFIMEVLESLILCALLSLQEFVPLFSFRMVQLTLRHGVCASTPFCFALYSMLLCGPFRDIKRGIIYGELALDLLEILQAEQKVSRVYLMLYNYPFVWSKPLDLLPEPLLDGYHKGMKVGDNQYAFACALQYIVYLFYSGKELSFVQSCMEDFESKIKQYKQHGLWKPLLPLKMILKILMGEVAIPKIFSGVGSAVDTLLEGVIEKDDKHQEMVIYFLKMMLAYLFGDYELAAQIADKNRGTVNEAWNGKYEQFLQSFYDGLIFLALARKNKGDRWVTNYNRVMEMIQTQAEAATHNVKPKLLLLEAEYAFFIGDNEASAKYHEAVESAETIGSVQDQSLAYERTGVHYLEEGNNSQASFYLGKSHNAYLDWGAKGKADHLCTYYPL